MDIEDTKVVIRDGQYLSSGSELFADFGKEEVLVAFDGAVLDDPRIAGLPDNEHGQSVQSPRGAMQRASLAATTAKLRDSFTSEGAILVMVEDLPAVDEN